MKFLLTSAGINNDSIRKALVDLLGKPIAESSALYIPTAVYALPGGAAIAWRLFQGVAGTPLCEVGWKSVVRPGGALAVAAPGGLRGGERREHGDGSQHRGGLRQLEALHWRRQNAGAARFCDFSARGSPGDAGQLDGQRRKMGRRGRGAGLRD